MSYGTLTNGVVMENIFGQELWRMYIKTSVCKVGYQDEGTMLIRSRTYSRTFDATTLGAGWSWEWKGMTNRLRDCEQIAGQRWCHRFVAKANGHAELSQAGYNIHKYPWVSTIYTSSSTRRTHGG